MEPKVEDKRSASAPKRETGRSCSQGGNTLDCRHECRREGYVASLLATSSSVSRNPQSRGPLEAWFADTRQATWNGPADVKADFGSTVDFIADNRVIFDIAGNKYRLVVHIAYRFRRVLVKFVGTHAEYDRIDPETVR